MTVHFIGAGPGAPDLITLRGRDLIANCPVCLYAGSIVPRALLDYCPAGALIVDTAPLSLDEIVKKMHMVAEGVKSVPAVIELADAHHVAMPIAREVYRVVHEGGTPRQAFRGLVRIQSGDESEPG